MATNGADGKFHGLLGKRVCDFENVKRYNVIMEERESSMARVVGLL